MKNSKGERLNFWSYPGCKNAVRYILAQTFMQSWWPQLTCLVLLSSCVQNQNNRGAGEAHDAYATRLQEPNTPLKGSSKEKGYNSFHQSLAASSNRLKSFVPDGYSVINISSGDANLDGIEDKILVLGKNNEKTTSNYADNKPDKRPLLILLGQADSSYKLALRNDNAILCIDCGGAFGDPFIGTTIKRGYFSIEHGISGGLHWDQITTFKFIKTQRQWVLFKDHLVSYKLNHSNSPDAEALVAETDVLKTAKDFGLVPFSKYDLYK